MTIDVDGHHYRRMPKAFLHDFRREPNSAIFASVDAPGGIEVPKRVHACVLGANAIVFERYASPDACWN
jgi:hypothetical protein